MLKPNLLVELVTGGPWNLKARCQQALLLKGGKKSKQAHQDSTSPQKLLLSIKKWFLVFQASGPSALYWKIYICNWVIYFLSLLFHTWKRSLIHAHYWAQITDNILRFFKFPLLVEPSKSSLKGEEWGEKFWCFNCRHQFLGWRANAWGGRLKVQGLTDGECLRSLKPDKPQT